jgi:hypothetical protein
MARGPLSQSDYSPQFAGHETFPLRYGWLKKVFDRVAETEREAANKTACFGEDAIARFGVGKNMVLSMRHWAKAAGIIREESQTNRVTTTPLGQRLFGPEGIDPYMEYPSTLWLIHWQLAARAVSPTVWCWAFNYYSDNIFDRDVLKRRLERFIQDQRWKNVSPNTLNKDVSCFIRTYVARPPSTQAGHDDALESPLTELGLIKATGKNGFRFVRGKKPTLGDGVFIYALLDLWSQHPHATTLSFELIAKDPGGPGRVFGFNDNDVVDRLAALEEVTRGKLWWSDSTGIHQVSRKDTVALNEETKTDFLKKDYKTRPVESEVA